MATILLEPNESFEHFHACESITTLICGEIEFSLQGKQLVMKEGDSISVPPQERHTMTNVGSTLAHVGALRMQRQDFLYNRPPCSRQPETDPPPACSGWGQNQFRRMLSMDEVVTGSVPNVSQNLKKAGSPPDR